MTSATGCTAAGATMIRQRRSRPWLAAVLLACVLLLVPWHGAQRFAAGQGLDVLDVVLGAGALATASEFERFEDAMSLGTTGGRGRGSRGGSGNLGGFGSAKDLQQLQVRSTEREQDCSRQSAAVCWSGSCWCCVGFCTPPPSCDSLQLGKGCSTCTRVQHCVAALQSR